MHVFAHYELPKYSDDSRSLLQNNFPTDKNADEKLIKFRHEIDGTLQRIGGPNFSDLIVKELHGNLPGDYHTPRRLPSKMLRTAVNARAREGYIYWYMEKPPPKSK